MAISSNIGKWLTVTRIYTVIYFLNFTQKMSIDFENFLFWQFLAMVDTINKFFKKLFGFLKNVHNDLIL